MTGVVPGRARRAAETRRKETVTRRGGRALSMAAARVPLWAVCVLRVALATVYFQEDFLDGGEGAPPVAEA